MLLTKITNTEDENFNSYIYTHTEATAWEIWVEFKEDLTDT